MNWLLITRKKNVCNVAVSNCNKQYSSISAQPHHSDDYDNTHFQNQLAIPQYLNDHCALQRDATASVNISLQECVGDCCISVAVSSPSREV